MKNKLETIYYCIKYFKGERSLLCLHHNIKENSLDEFSFIGDLDKLRSIFEKRVDYIRVKTIDDLNDLKMMLGRKR